MLLSHDVSPHPSAVIAKLWSDIEVETSAALLASPHQVVNVNVVCPKFKER